MILHPEDIAVVTEKGWGERHPLARGSWYWRTIHFLWRRKRSDPRPDRPPVPEYLCFNYAPRNGEEFKVIEDLLDAAIWFGTGSDFATGQKVEDPSPVICREAHPRKQFFLLSWQEKLNRIAEKSSGCWEAAENFFMKWVLICFGSVWFVFWLMEIHRVLL